MNELDELRKTCKELLVKTSLKKYDIIYKILLEDDCFFHMDIETSLRILKDLGKNSEEAIALYEKLLGTSYYLKNLKKI